MTTVTAIWVGPESKSPDLGRLESGTECEIPVRMLSSINWTATDSELDKANKGELAELAAALGIAVDEKATKADLVAAVSEKMTARQASAPTVTEPEGDPDAN